MTTLTDFAPKTNWEFYTFKFSENAPKISDAEQAKNCAFFFDSVTKGCYGNCESIYRDGCIRSGGYLYRPDKYFMLLVRPDGWDYVVRFLPGKIEDYTVAQIDKWVREFDGAAAWCIKPSMRWVPGLDDEEEYEVDPKARPTLTNDSF